MMYGWHVDWLRHSRKNTGGLTRVTRLVVSVRASVSPLSALFAPHPFHLTGHCYS